MRGGLTIDLGAPTGPHAGAGFTLSAVQVLDSNFATFGVLTGINATDTASATAGITSADNAGATFLPSGADFGSLLLGDAFGTIYGKYSEYRDRFKSQIHDHGDGGESASISLAGALAFSYTDHKAYTHIGGTADLNSAEHIELRSEAHADAAAQRRIRTTSHRTTRTAASSRAPAPTPPSAWRRSSASSTTARGRSSTAAPSSTRCGRCG